MTSSNCYVTCYFVCIGFNYYCNLHILPHLKKCPKTFDVNGDKVFHGDNTDFYISYSNTFSPTGAPTLRSFTSEQVRASWKILQSRANEVRQIKSMVYLKVLKWMWMDDRGVRIRTVIRRAREVFRKLGPHLIQLFCWIRETRDN